MAQTNAQRADEAPDSSAESFSNKPVVLADNDFDYDPSEPLRLITREKPGPRR
jgi:hypothetical protein